MNKHRTLAGLLLIAASWTAHSAPLAEGRPKFLGSAYGAQQAMDFAKYWNKVTPENAGKWGEV